MSNHVVKFSDDLCLDNALAGGKGSSLAKLLRVENINTKTGSVVTADVYNEIVRPAIREKMEQIQKIISKYQYDLDNLEEKEKEEVESLFTSIQKIINNLDLSKYFTDDDMQVLAFEPGKYYAVRSSATVEDGTKASFSGKFSTELFIKEQDFTTNLKKVWASVFSFSNLEYCISQKIDFNGINMAVVVQEMSTPTAAGTIFLHKDIIEIDTCLGLGEGVVRGDMRTDKIVLNHNTGQIVYTQTSEKKTKLNHDKTSGEVIEKELTEDETHMLSMTKNQINELVRQARLVEQSKYFRDNKLGLDMEYSCDENGNVYMLQTRAVTVERAKNQEEVNFSKSKKECVGSGLPVSAHVASGVLVICETPDDAFVAIAKHKPKKVIIVSANTTSQWESVMRKSAGVIAEIGSTNCHTAIACREMNIPGITNFADAKEHLKQFKDQEVTVCGTSGKVYRGAKDQHEIIRTTAVQTRYTPMETEEIVSRDKHLAQASAAKMTIEIDGVTYIGKPITPTCELISHMDKQAHKTVENSLGLPPANYLITGNKTLLMNFDDCHEWRRSIRKWSIEEHKRILELRKITEEEFLKATANLEMTEESIQGWITAYEAKIGFDNVAFAIGEILNGILHQAAKEKEITEPILSDLIPAEVGSMGHFEIEKCNESLRNIYAKLIAANALDMLMELEVLYLNRNSDPREISRKEAIVIMKLKELGIYDECRRIATSYRLLEKDFSLTFLEPWFQESSAPWLRLIIASKKLTDAQPQPLSTDKIKYYPDDEKFRPLIELAATSKKLHMDGHQSKAKGLWKFIDIIEQLSLNTGYTVTELLAKNPEELVTLVKCMELTMRPGDISRSFSAEQVNNFDLFVNVHSSNLSNHNKVSAVNSFCDQLPTADSLQQAGFRPTESRKVFPSKNTGLPAQLEQFEDQMGDSENDILPANKYRGENVRPSRKDYTQHQVAVEPDGGRVITMVKLDQNKTVINLDPLTKQGKPIVYSASYKWQNPALKLDSSVDIQGETYDEITAYSKILARYIENFRSKSFLDQIEALHAFKPKNPSIKLKVVINSNLPAQEITISEIIKRLLSHLEQEQHIRVITEKKSTLIYGRDLTAPKMQPVVRIPSKEQHEKFIQDTLFYVNLWRSKHGQAPIEEQEMFLMGKDALKSFLNETDHDSNAQKLFFEAFDAARKYKEYQRKPELKTQLDNGATVVVTMNDSIDVPSQALMLITREGNMTETNRPVNLEIGLKALYALLKDKYQGKPQHIVFSQLAYTQASSTQSMSHYHIVPNYNSEGELIIPYLDAFNEKRFSSFNDTSIDNVQVAYLDESIQKDYFNLVKFKIQLTPDESTNMKTFSLLSQKLQRWETESGCDMTWVIKFNPEDNSLTMCVELRAGINQYSQDQIDDFRKRNLWGKIGFTEVMGKKYSMLSQENFDLALQIYHNYPDLKEKMLKTPLYCIQISPEGEKSFYPYIDDDINTQNLDAQKTKDVLHIARVLQMYDAETFTHTMASMYHLHDDELDTFKMQFDKPRAKSVLID